MKEEGKVNSITPLYECNYSTILFVSIELKSFFFNQARINVEAVAFTKEIYSCAKGRIKFHESFILIHFNINFIILILVLD